MCSDLIDRQDVLDAVNDCGICIQKILDIPSAEPERKTGKWISHKNYDECSKCHCFTYVGFNFCPHCGAELTRGE